MKAFVCIALVLLVVLSVTFVVAEQRGLVDPGYVRDLLARAGNTQGGRAAVAALIGGLLALDLVLPLPSSVLMTASGMFLGPWTGTLVSFTGSLVSAVLGFGLCRRFGRAAFVRLTGESESARVAAFFHRYGPWAVLLSRPVPMMTEIVSCLAGLSTMTWGRFLALSTAGTLPVCVVYSLAGAYAKAEAQLWWAACVALLVPAIGFAVLRRGTRAGLEDT